MKLYPFSFHAINIFPVTDLVFTRTPSGERGEKHGESVTAASSVAKRRWNPSSSSNV